MRRTTALVATFTTGRAVSCKYLHRVPDQLVHHDNELRLIESSQDMLHQKTQDFLVLLGKR